MTILPTARSEGGTLRALALVGGALALAVAALAPDTGNARNARALWDVVHDVCVPDKRITRLPFPCTAVNRRLGYAVVKDAGRAGYLLVPTRRLTGIEDPRLLAAGVPNYWSAAWAARRFVQRAAGSRLPDEDLGLAINGRIGRTQDQLHIHVNCVREDVRDALAAARIGSRWTTLDLRGHPYSVRSLPEAELAARDPFRLLALDGPSGATALGDQTMALIGRATEPGAEPTLVLVAATADADNRGHAEELLDHPCGLAR